VHRQVTALIVGQERLTSFACPFDRPPKSAGRPRDQRELRVATVARTEVSAHLTRRHPDSAFRDTKGTGHPGLSPPKTPRTRMNRVAARPWVPHADGSARLHRDPGDSLHPRVEAHDVRGPCERGLRSRDVAGVGLHAHVRGGPVPEGGCATAGSVGADRHRRQRLPLHDDLLGAISRGGRGLGNDHRDCLAHMPNAVRWQRRMRRHEDHVVDRDDVLIRV
jgi:hypothetical protein